MVDRRALAWKPKLRAIQKHHNDKERIPEKHLMKTNLPKGRCLYCGKNEDILHPVNLTLDRRCMRNAINRAGLVNVPLPEFGQTETCDGCLSTRPQLYYKVNIMVCPKCLTVLGKRDGRYKNDKKHGRIK